MTPTTIQEAKQRSADYFGFSAAAFVKVDGGRVFEIPNPGLLDDDQLERYEELQFLMESCDVGDDGEPLTPYRINGELLRPSYSARLAIALFGEDGYAEYKAGGGSSSQIQLEWARMNREAADNLVTKSA